MNILKYHYTNIIKYDLLTKFHEKTPFSIGTLEKIVLNLGRKDVDLKSLLPFAAALELISYQNSLTTLAGGSNISLKIKKGAPTGCKVILRRKSLHLFFLDIISKIFPSIKQFEGFSEFKIKKSKAFSFKLNDILYFTEIENQYELFKDMSRLDISIITNNENVSHLNILLTSFRFPIK
jgi:ribosomal protein L5